MAHSLSETKTPQRICIVGADGKMGQALLRQVEAAEKGELLLSSAIVIANSPVLGKTVGALLGIDSEIILTCDKEAEAVKNSDVVIDFTRPEGTLSLLAHCLKYNTAMVIGTTGFDTIGQQTLQEAAGKIPIVLSTNMAPGINVLFHLVEKAAKFLSLYDAEIVETHHKHKIDAPSGTALTLGEQVLIGRGLMAQSALPSKRRETLNQYANFAREGETGARVDGHIGFSAIRGGNVVGEHQVMFLGDGERVELRHISTDRLHYASGALIAAKFLHHKKNGLYSMRDVLQLES